MDSKIAIYFKLLKSYDNSKKIITHFFFQSVSAKIYIVLTVNLRKKLNEQAYNSLFTAHLFILC